ncbi:GNAT family N-acetyltransferase [Adhaeribacter arboris]|uniref:GNAT family N-acetyltransferase n=1 Tax=Adhaeribacter arboris TaxID=2072846 RepID=A0A2T2YJH4_9BACT|nr:GNAT family N-acetyltransferase [Adhaeribacter arboris]PSR55652.1 GNAT family N-acetyltransferase [Adhaeribacter arboris]
MPSPLITYRTGNDLNLNEMIALYEASTLGERRPIQDRARMQAMLQHANLVITAWADAQLVGIARAFSDFAFVTYLSDLAVHRDFQKQGIGKELIKQTQLAGGPHAKIVLLAAPAAEHYYPRIGFTHHPQAWMLNGDAEIK